MAQNVPSVHNRRVVALLEHLWAEGGEWQEELDAFAKRLEMPRGALVRWVRWCELWGVVRVKRTTTGGFAGRAPNTYTTTMTREEWREHGPRIASEMRARLSGRPAPPPPTRERVIPEAWLAAEAEAREEVGELLESMPALEPLEVEPLEDDEVDAWTLLGDYN